MEIQSNTEEEQLEIQPKNKIDIAGDLLGEFARNVKKLLDEDGCE